MTSLSRRQRKRLQSGTTKLVDPTPRPPTPSVLRPVLSEGDLSGLLAGHSNLLAALAWEGFQHRGRGVVRLVVGEYLFRGGRVRVSRNIQAVTAPFNKLLLFSEQRWGAYATFLNENWILDEQQQKVLPPDQFDSELALLGSYDPQSQFVVSLQPIDEVDAFRAACAHPVTLVMPESTPPQSLSDLKAAHPDWAQKKLLSVAPFPSAGASPVYLH